MNKLAITIIQTQLHWENKEANIAMFERKIKAINEKTEVVILPEMFTTGFSMNPRNLAEKMDGDTMKWMKKIAAEKKIILTGSIIAEEDGRYYNRLIWMLPNGEYGIYDKRHLFAYADEQRFYTPGRKRLIASVNGWKLNMLICYDLRFPVWARQSGSLQPEYDVLIYVANWPEKRSLAWKTLLQARAVENQCYVVGVNRVGEDGNGIYYAGDSIIISPTGEIEYQELNEEDVFTFTMEKEKLREVRERYPFWKDADLFNINL